MVSGVISRAIRRPAGLFALLLLAATVLRGDTFGDPNLHGDESFYHTVALAMHHGALPYVDVWDRKPFGLFLLYYLVAFASEAPLAYQIAATLCAAGTAWAIAMIARASGVAEQPGGVLAALAYLLWLAPMQGFGGQSPVFYNLFIALAALIVLRATPALREGRAPRSVFAAMALAGFGVTIKTTALFEAAFLGLWCVAALSRSGARAAVTARLAAAWALTGAAPALAIAAGYALAGHWAEYWHAMVASNLDKAGDWPTAWLRLRLLLLALSPILLLGLLGLLRGRFAERGFLLGWLAAAVIGLCAVPNFYPHYALPLMVPLCVLASGFLARGIVGVGAVAALALFSVTIASPFRYGQAARSRAALETMASVVQAHDGDGPLLLYDAPPQLYPLTGHPFPTPLVFPTHLSHLIEKDVSHLSTLGETRRVLAMRPGAVVMAVTLRNGPGNEETHQAVLRHVGRHCRLVGVVKAIERQREDWMAIWGECRQ